MIHWSCIILVIAAVLIAGGDYDPLLKLPLSVILLASSGVLWLGYQYGRLSMRRYYSWRPRWYDHD